MSRLLCTIALYLCAYELKIELFSSNRVAQRHPKIILLILLFLFLLQIILYLNVLKISPFSHHNLSPLFLPARTVPNEVRHIQTTETLPRTQIRNS